MKTQPKIQTVSDWLDIALKDLSPAEKERITLEIKAHYADALETHLAEGRNESEASFKALKELGYPDKAAKVYRKKYLTLEEDDEIYNILTQVRPNYSWLRICLAFSLYSLVLGIVIPQRFSLNPYALLVCFFITIGIGLVLHLSLRSFKLFPNEHTASRLLLIQALGALGSNTLMAIFSLNMFVGVVGWTACILIFLVGIYHAHRWLRIRSKFLRTIA